MLREAMAWALLETHCGLLRNALWANVTYHPCAHWLNNACDHVDLIVVVPPSGATPGAPTAGRDMGAQLRLAFGVVQAVSCCAGFEPATQQDFCRRVVQTLWFTPHDTRPTRACMFSATTFAHIGVQWVGDDTFWVGVFHGTHACDAMMAAVLKTLGPHLAIDALRPLRVSLSYCWARADGAPRRDHGLSAMIEGQRIVRTQALKIILHAAHTTPTETRQSRRTATYLGLVDEYLMDQDRNSTLDTLERLAQVRTPTRPHVQFTIDRLVIQLAPPVPPRCTNPPPRVRTVAVLECSFSDYRLVGSALSAVALASPPIEELRCTSMFDSWRSKEQLLRLAWLAYALHRRHRLSGSSPSVLSLVAAGTVVTKQECQYIEQLIAGGTPLRDVVGEALRLRFGGNDDTVARLHVECVPLGSTVQLVQGTRLYVEPMRVADEFVVVTLDTAAAGDDCGEAVDLVAHLTDNGGVVGVVYGGYGLLWTDAACAVDWQWLDGDFAMRAGDVDSRGDRSVDVGTLALSSLALGFSVKVAELPFERCRRIHRADAVLPLFACTTLETLTLNRAVIIRNDLAQVLDSFPRLETLNLDRCVVESLAPLADAYRRAASRRARVAVLSLLGARDLSMRDKVLRTTHLTASELLRPCMWVESNDDRAVTWMAPLVDALTAGVTDGVLRELYVDLMGMCEADEYATVRRLAHAVTAASTRSLTRLHVACRWVLQAAYAAQLGPMRVAVLRDPPRVRCAVLSVLRAFGCGAPEVARTVLALCAQSHGWLADTPPSRSIR